MGELDSGTPDRPPHDPSAASEAKYKARIAMERTTVCARGKRRR
jgi:hypothetical protein